MVMMTALTTSMTIPTIAPKKYLMMMNATNDLTGTDPLTTTTTKHIDPVIEG